jgi:peptidoglycan hydrolase-like protein with peptidoglycan-binding domain
MAKGKRTTVFLIVIAAIITAGTIAVLVYNKRKKTKGQTVAGSVSSAFTSGYKPEAFPLKKGMYGNNVKILQWCLESLGYSCGITGVDGKFGDSTLSAVRRFYNNPSKNEVTLNELLKFNTELAADKLNLVIA